jgi:hypothetical protein
MNVLIPVSVGELWDKYSILIIKKTKITDIKKLKHVETEIEHLTKYMMGNENHDLFIKLKTINQTLWEIEDKLRIKEQLKQFDKEFIDLARSVYYTNDARAEIKKEINVLYNSLIHEVKSYVNYNTEEEDDEEVDNSVNIMYFIWTELLEFMKHLR